MKQVYIFEYDENWMILFYKDGEEDKYWNSSEDSWDKTLGIIGLLEIPEEDIFRYKLDNYKQVRSLVKDVFDITEEEKNNLEQFRI